MYFFFLFYVKITKATISTPYYTSKKQYSGSKCSELKFDGSRELKAIRVRCRSVEHNEITKFTIPLYPHAD